jgi:hypothetical protein
MMRLEAWANEYTSQKSTRPSDVDLRLFTPYTYAPRSTGIGRDWWCGVIPGYNEQFSDGTICKMGGKVQQLTFSNKVRAML